ncbi:MAG: hypothetical protein ABIT96_00935 [Ferruginibacter sp.]
MHNFTQEDLLQYLYKESNSEITAAIEAALQSNYILRQQLEELASSKECLESIKIVSPRKQTLDAIMQYAEKSIGELTTH